MNEIKLLILDDDQNVIDSYNEIIRRVNRDEELDYSYKVYSSKTLEEASEIIKYNKLDTAIIDLNLNNGNQSDPDNANGNNAIEELMQNFRMPIFVVSGELSKLDDGLKSNKLIKQESRDDFTRKSGFETIIPPLFKSKSIHYFSRDGFLEQKINKFYWDHLSKTIDSWVEVEAIHPQDIEKILSRHTVACLNEQLYVNGNRGSFDQYHPGEMYIIPAIKKHYHTGDIIKKDNDLFIIINPACDIVNKNKLNMYTIVRIIKAYDIANIMNKTEQQKNTYIESNFKKTNNIDRYHFLPKFNAIDDNYVIDFQNISIVEIGADTNSGNANYFNDREENIKSYEKIASISSSFLKDVIARFSAYYARQGQPNLL